jgi:hypothetical protein
MGTAARDHTCDVIMLGTGAAACCTNACSAASMRWRRQPWPTGTSTEFIKRPREHGRSHTRAEPGVTSRPEMGAG